MFASSHNQPDSLSSEEKASSLLKRAIGLAQQNLLRLQNADGHWAGELIVDTTLCSDYIMFMHWAGNVDRVLQDKCAAHIKRCQLPDGGWNIYYDGPSEVNATVKAYFALKLAGEAPDTPAMCKARAAALHLGGIPRMNTYDKLYLALLGQFPWSKLPTIPVEIVLLPNWFPFNLYKMSSWSRAMVVPLAILNHLRPTKRLHPSLEIKKELVPPDTDESELTQQITRPWPRWRNFFILVDRLLKRIDSLEYKPLRNRAIKVALDWLIERMGPGSHGLGAIFPAMLNSIIVLKAMGYDDSHPDLAKALRDFESLFVDDPEDFRIQPCLSPVWDTAINLIALTESGCKELDGGACSKAAKWLIDREVRIRGDWAVRNPHPEASGWSFEYRNDYYPDTDDTMMVLMALRFTPPSCLSDEGVHKIFKRALPWLLSFQCKDGGWAAFDKDITQKWLEGIPFADHNAILDPSCSDLTGRMLELLGYIGFDHGHATVRRAVTFLRRTQEPDGSWYGRWGVNYLYGTWQVLRGLRAIGEPMDQEWLTRARDWLESVQNEDGGWGESPQTYATPSLKGQGESTPSQTAWALMGLCACGDLDRPSIARGIQWLLTHQNRDGSWNEPQTTGTGFPCVFYLNYDMYRNNFPLMALSTYANENHHPRSRYRCDAGQ